LRTKHAAPFDALVLMVDGEAEITVAGRANRLKASEMLFLPATQPHGQGADEVQDGPVMIKSS